MSRRVWLTGLAVFGCAVLAASERQIVLDAMEARPSGVWPRGTGHVVLGIPGSTEDEKAYLEPGGSFSPSFGSFGVQLAVENSAGELEAVSDFVQPADLRQRFVWPRGRGIPAVRTETPDYTATWTLQDGRRWQLEAASLTQPRLVLALRSVGPAGGPITNVAWNGRMLRLNDRWTITPSPRPLEVRLGYQNPTNASVAEITQPPVGSGPRVIVTQGASTEADRQAGWGRAMLVFGREATLTIEDIRPPAPNPLKWKMVRSELTLDLPDARFAESLNAQVAHLMMGLVRNETRPGDPNNYPLNWLRDGAMEIVALARAGQVDVARQLCVPFAEQDFFGGFGAEADGPGSSLWAITEVAAMADDSKFDAFLRRHVRRKVELINEMLNATGPVRKPWTGPLVPGKGEKMEPNLVCEAARGGLIWGKMDGQRPVLYVNAVTYAGLRNAVNFALRTRDNSVAVGWGARAEALRTAWNARLGDPALANERTRICGLHPTWVVRDREVYRAELTASRARSHDATDTLKGRPLWTYFNAAEANQWLLLGEPERAWRDLRWFWANQASPGLYTWWEGSGEENSFGRWEQVRGWVNPPYVTPHCWTAAELLLLQLNMLAHVDEAGQQPLLVVAAGVPAEWLLQRLTVAGLQTKYGPVGWDWDGRRVRVRAPGFTPGSVRLTGVFPAGTRLEMN